MKRLLSCFTVLLLFIASNSFSADDEPEDETANAMDCLVSIQKATANQDVKTCLKFIDRNAYAPLYVNDQMLSAYLKMLTVEAIDFSSVYAKGPNALVLEVSVTRNSVSKKQYGCFTKDKQRQWKLVPLIVKNPSAKRFLRSESVSLFSSDESHEFIRKVKATFSKKEVIENVEKFQGSYRTTVATMKQLHTAQAIYKEKVSEDANGNGRGEYAADFFELTGENLSENLSPNAIGVSQINMEPNPVGAASKNGYCYAFYLPTSVDSKNFSINDDETKFVCFAWPLEWGVTGMKVIMINEDGRLYVHENKNGKIGNGFLHAPAVSDAYKEVFDNSSIGRGFELLR